MGRTPNGRLGAGNVPTVSATHHPMFCLNVTLGPVNRVFTILRDDGSMSTIDFPVAELTNESVLDPQKVFETIVTDLEMLTADCPAAPSWELVELHAALLVYELGERVTDVQTARASIRRRPMLERRVARAALRLLQNASAQSSDAELRSRATESIEALIHLIDPELRVLAS